MEKYNLQILNMTKAEPAANVLKGVAIGFLMKGSIETKPAPSNEVCLIKFLLSDIDIVLWQVIYLL